MNRKLSLAILPVAVQEALKGLEHWPDVTRFSAHSGQVLVYPGHVPPGVFLVLAGVVVLEPADPTRSGRPMRKDAAQGAFVLPPPDAIEVPAKHCVRLDQPAELLFIPRSLIHEHEELRRLLADARLSAVQIG